METVKTPEEIVETLGEICGNTMGNDRKWLGNWGNITSRESPSYNYAENKTDRFSQFCVYLICTKIVKISIFYT